MLNIVVSSRDRLRYNVFKLLKEYDKVAVISITEPPGNDFVDLSEFGDKVKYRLKLVFDDIDDEKYGRVISDEDVKNILDFFEKIKKDNIKLLICQCRAGVSRSAAVAAAAHHIINGHHNEHIILKDKRYYPNITVLSKIISTYNYGDRKSREEYYNKLFKHLNENDSETII